MAKKLKLKNEKKFKEEKSKLSAQAQAYVDLANAAFASGGARGLALQSIANGKDMLARQEAAINAASDEELNAVIDAAVKEWKESVRFMSSEAAELVEEV